ncbi:MAG TPA: 3-phosphoglycerate dehydrogenase family protein [Propionibacteriaceae bacterium]|nr:3-phosphoglycerate dehydrogenase family protein [Propionibacteriaceae bacterium]
MTEKYRVRVLNHISAGGLKRLPWDRFAVSADVDDPHAVLVRSADLHDMEISESLLTVGRAGSGTNNIPIARMSERGIPVFNAPGANANAVKELVVAGMLLASRNIDDALKYLDSLDPDDPELEQKVEAGKKAFAGYELAGQTLGIVGLGKIGCLVADAAIKLGMHVIGYDPEITVDSAWSLPATVKKAHSLGEVLKHSNFLTLHVPLVDATRGMVDAGGIAQMKAGAVVLNFSRGGVVDETAILEALETGQLAKYVCDFPAPHLAQQAGVILLPHLGASTREAEENCAVMVAEQVRDYLLDGTIRNSVNFPDVIMPRESLFRVAIANANVPNMVGGISHEMAMAGLNIATMTNKSRRDLAYTLVDVDSEVPDSVIKAIGDIDGVLMVRYLPLPN